MLARDGRAAVSCFHMQHSHARFCRSCLTADQVQRYDKEFFKWFCTPVQG
jgi:hypothetical protein